MDSLAKNKKIVLALSGGVDSSVAADILQKDGYTVVGVYFVMSKHHTSGVELARQVANSLGIEFFCVDMQQRFEQHVVDYFCECYANGKTPNPCIVCNPNVKFKALCDLADSLNITEVATGHYANIKKIGNFSVLSFADYIEKDQSYMLSSLPQEILNRVVFPLGKLTKPQVRNVAKDLNLVSADKPDSQEICFIPDNNYPGFLKERGVFGKKGCFVLETGEKLKPHDGVECYTQGQRKGLGVSFKHPLYVNEIKSNGDIILSDNDALFKTKVFIGDILINSCFDVKDGDEFSTKLRSASKPARCFVEFVENNTICLNFIEPQRAPAKGQRAVLYRDGTVVLSGEILSAK